MGKIRIESLRRENEKEDISCNNLAVREIRIRMINMTIMYVCVCVCVFVSGDIISLWTSCEGDAKSCAIANVKHFSAQFAKQSDFPLQLYNVDFNVFASF